MPKQKIKRKINKKNGNRFGVTPIYLMLLVLIAAVALVLMISKMDISPASNYNKQNVLVNKFVKNSELKKFSSAEEFEEYIKLSDNSANYYGGSWGVARDMVSAPELMMDDVMLKAEESAGTGGTNDARVSGTNVQVVGIDEPDIVKTDGEQIYFSDTEYYYYGAVETRPFLEVDDFGEAILPPDYYQVNTSIINALPADDISLQSELDLAGNLLLSDDNLLVFAGQNIFAYDVSDTSKPTKTWDFKIGDNTSLLDSRLYNDKVYLITRTYINRYRPCPIEPFVFSDSSLKIACSDIYHPLSPIDVDSTYTVSIINPASGDIERTISFVANYSSSVVYMSENALYLSYGQNADMFDFMYDFVTTEMRDVLPSDIITRLNRLSTYDISKQSKVSELYTILEEWVAALDDDTMLQMETEMQNRMTKYYEKNKRALSTTGLVKIDTKNLEIKANGNVPGYILNQFSIDEYDGYLRVATTIGNRFGWGFGSDVTQANDVYVLDKNLNIASSILDLGLEERIYSARFIGDKGYLVTFRQIDPFYVLDLSNPKDAKMVGELKIPGYSSYLHPISDDRILGIGMEDGQVKLSYFDVSDPANPQEIDKYSLDEYGSDALYNHHAFLMDSKHQVFFLPSYKGGYIFSYANDSLELTRAVSVPNVQRALYIGDHMYILAQNYVAVLNEQDWEKVSELDL